MTRCTNSFFALCPSSLSYPLRVLIECEIQPKAIADQIDALQTGVDVTLSFAEELSRQLSGSCEEGSGPNVVAELTLKTNELFCTLANLAVTFRKFFQCQTWYPLYQSLMVDTLCYSATPAFAWLASTQFVILMMTLVILTLRVVIWDLEDNNIGEKEDVGVHTDEPRNDIVVQDPDEEEKEGASFEKKDEVDETSGEIACQQEVDEVVYSC
jgi:hypothetical protein